MPLPVILIFDVGKTNKKVLLFDKQYNLVFEESMQLPEIRDEDGFPCEDIDALTTWLMQSFQQLRNDKRFEIIAINASAYGASLVHLNYEKKPFLPLYNYLKPQDAEIRDQFYRAHGDAGILAKETASPVLGNLNSGMQLYGLKYKQPDAWAQLSCSLHLPQYISCVLSGALHSDITSIGCHTMLWDFKKHDYHDWVYKEQIHKKLAPLISCTEAAGTIDKTIAVGCGLHDSSAALIPYFASFHQPFVLLSTGTWSISINPFNHTPLTTDELNKDCLSYLSFQGSSVKASRLFAGYEHEQQVNRLAGHFNKPVSYFTTIQFDGSLCNKLHRSLPSGWRKSESTMVGQSPFGFRNVYDFETSEEAYHQLIFDIMRQQVQSTKLLIQTGPVEKIFVDGGFSKNDVYMNLLAEAFPHIKVYSATVAQASALGAAIAIRRVWNDAPLPPALVTTKLYTPLQSIVL